VKRWVPLDAIRAQEARSNHHTANGQPLTSPAAAAATAAAAAAAEGLVYYLPPCAVQQLLSCIEHISAPKSRIMMDFLHLSSLSGAVWHPGFESLWISVFNKGEIMHSGIDERPAAVEALMRKFGFHTHVVLTGRDLVGHYMPHVQYKSMPGPTVSPYFGYLSAEKL
jgi:O-methyltransferase involved in polyketide biosynthesis